MTATVTQEEKRQALALWEGWSEPEQIGQVIGHWNREQTRWGPLPQYFHDGNAMLGLLARLDTLGWGWEIEATPTGIDVRIHPTDDATTSASANAPEELPSTVAQAVYDAI